MRGQGCPPKAILRQTVNLVPYCWRRGRSRSSPGWMWIAQPFRQESRQYGANAAGTGAARKSVRTGGAVSGWRAAEAEAACTQGEHRHSVSTRHISGGDGARGTGHSRRSPGELQKQHEILERAAFLLYPTPHPSRPAHTPTPGCSQLRRQAGEGQGGGMGRSASCRRRCALDPSLPSALP